MTKTNLWVGVAGMCLVVATSLAQNATLPYKNPDLPVEQRVEDLVSRMTLEEKVSQMVNAAPAIPHLGVPAYNWWSEGLHGDARSGYATVFPQVIGMAATWDTRMVQRMGEVTSVEARARYNQAIRDDLHEMNFGLTLWAPNLNIFRDPRWGRGQETYGEDPYLTGRMAVAFVEGMQGNDPRYLRTVATPKHYVVHSGPEPERHRMNAVPSPYDLHATYLPAFRAAITEAHADSVMCAYNAVDGKPACANPELLTEFLRRQWGFRGFVTSDCDAIADIYEPAGHRFAPDAEHASAVAVQAGTDTDCGSTFLSLTRAVRSGILPESSIDTAVKRLFTARFRLGMFDPPDRVPYARIPFSEIDSAAHRAESLKAARESMVLLRNQGGTLPLRRPRTIAVIGPNAISLASLQGNYNAIPSHPVLALDGVKHEFPAARVLYAQGASFAKDFPLVIPRDFLRPAAGSTGEGLKAEYFAHRDFSGVPALTRVDPEVQFDWYGASPAPGIPVKDYSIRWTGEITFPEAGDYLLHVRLDRRDQFTLYLDGRSVATNIYGSEAQGRRRRNDPFSVHIADTRPHSIKLEYAHHGLFGSELVLEWAPPSGALLRQAVAAARAADVVLAYVGISPDLEGEEMRVDVKGFHGGDRTSINLPQVQQDLLEALAASGKPLVVILMNGSALAVDWAATHAQAILEAWYPGEAGGQAIAETLSGANNPGGKLPVTFYASDTQLPPFEDYSMKGRTYRYFEGKPLYGFGYGLSYTRFAFSNLRLSSSHLQAGESLSVDADVRNSGKLAGDEVAELYLTPPKTDVSPIHELRAFTRIHLGPGETQHVHFLLSPRQLSQVNDRGERNVEPGHYVVSVGGGQPAESPHLSAGFAISGRTHLPQ